MVLKCRISVKFLLQITRLSLLRILTDHLETSIDSPALNGEREARRPLGDLLLELVDAGNLAAGNLDLEVLELVGLLGESGLDLLAELDALVNVVGDALKVGLAEATRSHGRGTNTETTGSKGALVAGNSVFVAGDVDLLKESLNTGTVEAEGAEVEENHVRIGTARDESVAESLELVLKSLSVRDDLLLVGLELGVSSLLEGNSESGDGMVVRTTLVTREDGEVDLVLEIVESLLARLGVDGANTLAEEDHGTTGTTEGLVSGGSDNIGVEEGGGNNTGGDEPRDVGNINDEVGANGVSNLAHALIVDEAAVGRGTGNENLGAEELGILLELVIIDDAGLEVHAVGHGLEVGRDSRDSREGRRMLVEPAGHT